jgi:hypothetical protein
MDGEDDLEILNSCCVDLIRISRWIDDEEERTKGKGEMGVQYVVLDMGDE